MFTHGVYGSETPSKIRGIVTVNTPTFVVGTAPINMGDMENVNKVQIIYNIEEAMKYFGGTSDLNFTISEVLDTHLNIFGASPVVCVNVLDPKRHKTSHTEGEAEGLTLVEKKVTLSKKGILPKTLKVTNIENSQQISTEKVSYQFDIDGKMTIEVQQIEAKKVKVEYEFLDPSKVTKEDIIGGIDPTTLERKGLACVDQVFSKYSMIPGSIIAPGYSHEAEVKAIIDAKASMVSGKYESMGIIDLKDTLKYGEAVEEKKKINFIDEDLILCYGKIRLGEKIYHQSSMLAALIAKTDNKNEGIPYESPSNLDIKGQALVYKNAEGVYEDIDLEEEQANLLNANGITTAIRRTNGFVSWGNRTSLYQPGGSTDPKDIWICAKRMFKFIGNTLVLNTSQDVDRPMTYTRAETIMNTINIFLAGLTSAEKLYGGRIKFNKEENPETSVLEGKFKWHVYLGTVIPAETLHFVREFDGEYIKNFVEKISQL
ncbi:MAG: phage tail sheath family protein [Fusobacterium necrophorum]|uniref:phage tail sheath family protein n=1 Tax=Fusobacterium TaxID=848 RepID=UPI001012A347|nr:phage tail sheath family protein [Fusobacterium necrophorum]MDY2573597.1 phage tail sheath family protein [Fusobacterium necrophorum]MDY6173212.1 phage tail sheath family protein [Fusobacterium necrophorum]RXZ26621.1 phage tail sheath family protein [Fusobacterium necrophorum]